MAKNGDEARVIYLDVNGSKKTASGKIDAMDNYIKVELKPSKRRENFNTLLISWQRIIKVIIY